MTAVRVSVIVPVRNGEAHLPGLLAALQGQDVAGGLEIVAVDSGSRDGGPALLRQHGARVVDIAPESFDHGETRNLGVREARGSVVVFLTQDARPSGASFVRLLAEALEGDPRLAGVFARQIPRPDADPLTRRDLAAWVACGDEPRTVFVANPARLAALPPLERYRLAVFDNVASAARRELLSSHPFAATRFGEDVEWGYRMLRHGYGLGYVPAAAVIHSHRRSARSLFRRNYLGHRALHRLFGLETVPDVPHLIRASVGAVANDLTTLARDGASPAAWLSAPFQALAATLGQYRGARDEALGRRYPEWA